MSFEFEIPHKNIFYDLCKHTEHVLCKVFKFNNCLVVIFFFYAFQRFYLKNIYISKINAWNIDLNSVFFSTNSPRTIKYHVGFCNKTFFFFL